MKTKEYGFAAYRDPQTAKSLIPIVQKDPKLRNPETLDAAISLSDIGRSDYDYGYNLNSKPVLKLFKQPKYQKIMQSSPNTLKIGHREFLTDKDTAAALLGNMNVEFSKKYPRVYKDIQKYLTDEAALQDHIRSIKQTQSQKSDTLFEKFRDADIDLSQARDAKKALKWFDVLNQIKTSGEVHKKRKLRDSVASESVKSSLDSMNTIEKARRDFQKRVPKSVNYAKWSHALESAINDNNDLFHWRSYEMRETAMEKLAYADHLIAETRNNLQKNWNLFKKDNWDLSKKIKGVAKTAEFHEDYQQSPKLNYSKQGAIIGGVTGVASGGKKFYKGLKSNIQADGILNGLKNTSLKGGMKSALIRAGIGAVSGAAIGAATDKLKQYNEEQKRSSVFSPLIEKFAEDPEFSVLKEKIISQLMSNPPQENRYVKDISCEICGYKGKPNNRGQCPDCGATGGVTPADTRREVKYDSKLIGVPQNAVSVYDLDWMARQNDRVL